MNKISKLKTVFFGLGFGGLVLAGCTEVQDRAVVYGERSGVNIALRSDPAKALPVEVNAGVQRRVTTLVPPKARNTSGRPTDEAVNLISNFDLTYNNADASKGLFGGSTRISSVFTTGAAATALASTIDQPSGTPDGLAEAVEASRAFVNQDVSNQP